MTMERRPLAVLVGGLSDKGMKLASLCAEHDFDLIIASSKPSYGAIPQMMSGQAVVQALHADVCTMGGADALISTLGGRSVHTVIVEVEDGPDRKVNCCGHLSDSPFDVSRLLARLQARRAILIDWCIAAQSKPLEALCRGDFLDSFSWALEFELAECGASAICLSSASISQPSTETTLRWKGKLQVGCGG